MMNHCSNLWVPYLQQTHVYMYCIEQIEHLTNISQWYDIIHSKGTYGFDQKGGIPNNTGNFDVIIN